MRANNKNSRYKSDRLRQALADETAKIITLEGVRDFHRAKIKASERLGNSHHGSLPSNIEIEKAILSFQKTFLPEHKKIITAQRRVARDVMQWLQTYAPFLVGEVLEGTSGVNSPISIHVSSDTVEMVVETIREKVSKIETTQRRLKLNNEFVQVPTIIFDYKNFEIEIVVFSLRQRYQLPKSKSQNRSMQRMNLKTLQEMLRPSEMQG